MHVSQAWGTMHAAVLLIRNSSRDASHAAAGRYSQQISKADWR